jgi:hypothetical protein
MPKAPNRIKKMVMKFTDASSKTIEFIKIFSQIMFYYIDIAIFIPKVIS